jgi:hypothetical protein
MSRKGEMMTKKEKQFIEDMTRCRGVDWIRLGMKIEVNGNAGTIVGMNSGGNLDVFYANQLRFGKGKHNCHPFWKTRYFGKDEKVIKDYTAE